MNDLISRKKAIAALSQDLDNDYTDLYHDGYIDGKCDAIDIIKTLPSAESPTRCIAEVKFDKKDLEELVNEKIEEIKEMKSENDDFLNFLFNMINPNEMEAYLAMYNSQGEAGR